MYDSAIRTRQTPQSIEIVRILRVGLQIRLEFLDSAVAFTDLVVYQALVVADTVVRWIQANGFFKGFGGLSPFVLFGVDQAQHVIG